MARRGTALRSVARETVKVGGSRLINSMPSALVQPSDAGGIIESELSRSHF